MSPCEIKQSLPYPFRAYDYMKQLEGENETADKDLGQLQAQVR